LTQNGDKFAKVLIEAVDDGLLILGESARKAIYYHLEKEHSLKREEVLENLEVFAKGLEDMFGAGALVIEKSILANLHSKLGLKFEERKNCRFIDYLKKAKDAWLNKDETSE